VSYLSKDKWHVAKVVITGIVGDKFYAESANSTDRAPAGPRLGEGVSRSGSALPGRPIPANIIIGQPVGVSFKHSYGKFVFDTTVAGLEQSSASGGGTIVLAVPLHITVVQRRSYFRVNVPESLKVNVVFWHRSPHSDENSCAHDYYQGRLVDLSAGGIQIVMPTDSAQGGPGGEPDDSAFRKGQFIGLRFTPLPYETPLTFNAQVRNILPTADYTGLCLGLQIVGLEASPEGRQTLSRIAAVVERYHQINEPATGGPGQRCTGSPAARTA
jgi:hypothetical protein